MILQMIISGVIFLISIYLIFSEKLNRSIVAIAGAVVMVIAGTIFNFYTEEQAFKAIDFNTIGLLLGMMILVSLLEPTGFFQFIAVWAGRLSKGKPVRLMILLGTVTTILSMFLDNVTTVVLIAPVTILISEVLGVNTTPLLMVEALLSNTGGVATLVGDPPNVLIASAANLSFTDFLTHSLPIVVVTWLVALVLLRFLFRRELAQPPIDPKAIMKLNPRQALEDPITTRRVLIVLAGALILFLLQGKLQISASFIALGAAAAALVLARQPISEVLQRIEWSVLVFFAGLFIIVGGMESAGVLYNLALFLAQFNETPPMLFGIILIWAIAILSAVIDNVPITIAMIPIIEGLGSSGMSVQPLWWALVLGAGLGGNATIIGSTANIVVVSVSEKTRTPITSKIWTKRGLPVMIVTCFVATILYGLTYSWMCQ